MNTVDVFVTGGTGFLGHNLIKALQEDRRIGIITVYVRNPPPTEERLSDIARNISPDLWIELMADMELIDPYNTPMVKKSSELNDVFARGVREGRIRFVYGDICERDKLEEGMMGSEIVFHMCGNTRWWDAVNEEQRRVNVTGTRTLWEAVSNTASVKRVIYTSTVDVMGRFRRMRGRKRSDQPYSPFPDDLDDMGVLDERWDVFDSTTFAGMGYNYADTKREAELLIRQMHKDSNGRVELIVLRPGSVIGPWDVTNQYGRLFKDIKSGYLMGIPCGGTSVCSARDVVLAHISAAFFDKAAHPEHHGSNVFILAGENVSYREFFTAIWKKLRYPAYKSRVAMFPCIQVIPKDILVAYSYLCQWYSDKISGTDPEVNPGMARYLSQKCNYCSDKAKKFLGYHGAEPGRWKQGVDESYEWYKVRGRI